MPKENYGPPFETADWKILNSDVRSQWESILLILYVTKNA